MEGYGKFFYLDRTTRRGVRFAAVLSGYLTGPFHMRTGTFDFYSAEQD
jgi:hypothetical protein